MKIVAMAGGVGGAKLVDGLAQILSPGELTVIVNTGDDFEHLGLFISPDLDTVCYMLAGLANPNTGWGRDGETFRALENIKKLGGPAWFALGDQDLGTHLERTRRIKSGQSISQVTHDFCLAWGIKQTVLPMSDEPVHTMVDTVEFGEMAFQEYFVHHKCDPVVQGFRFAGIENALPAPGVLEAIDSADAIIFCPSNPWVSIDPILSVQGIRQAIVTLPIIAVSPIIGDAALKGPAAKMFKELGIPPSAVAVARHYGDLLNVFILDKVDSRLLKEFSIPAYATNTIMKTRADRHQLAEDVLHLIRVK
jgi:LPPG:FO 2-phospho-L-lactate transferase